MATLTYTGKVYGTDKATYHGFTDFYEEKFNELDFHPRTILEIGIKEGSSLRMWHSFFPKAIVIGVDINPAFDIPGVITMQGDATDSVFFDRIRHIPFDLIIDDGSHMTADQQKTFVLFSQLLTDDGIYILEDLHSSYIKSYVNSSIPTDVFLKTYFFTANWKAEIFQKDKNVFHDSMTALIKHL